MSFMYRVSASALNLRALPSKTAARITAIPRDALVVREADPALAADWYKVNWNGRSGYASSAYLEPVPGTPQAPAPLPSVEIELPPAGAVEVRDRDMRRLHPVVRQAVESTVAALNSSGIPFRVFEGFRTPERQRWLFAQGRTRPGSIVTKAKPWQSMHQYGLAVDLVLFDNGQWSWDDSGSRKNWWTEMHEVARQHDLVPLSFEMPHVELKNATWQSLQQGQLPAGGDEEWYETIAFAAERWRRSGDGPQAPPLSIGTRPALAAADASS